MLLTLIATKWCVVGRLRPGSYEVYSFYFIRWWMLYVLTLNMPISIVLCFLRYTFVVNWLFRAMGSKIGKNVLLGQGAFGVPCVYDYDMISIGDDTHVDMNCYVMGSDVRGGYLHLGRTHIGKASNIGMGAVVMPGTTLGDNAMVAAFSLLNGVKGEPFQAWTGAPGKLVQYPILPKRPRLPCNFVLQLVGLAAVGGCFELIIWGSGQLASVIASTWGDTASVVIMLMLGYLPLAVVFLIFTIVMKWLLLGCVRPGVQRLSSWYSACLWFIDTLFNSMPAQMGLAMCDPAVMQPLVFRALGARVGKRQILASPCVRNGAFDLLTIGDDFVTGNQLYVEPTEWDGDDQVEFKPVIIGHKNIFGNGVFLPGGVQTAGDVTLGTMCVIPRPTTLDEFSTWSGNPARIFGVHRDDDEAQAELLQQEAWGGEDKEELTQYYCLGAFFSFCGPLIEYGMFGGMLVMAYYGSHITIAFLDAGTFASIGIAALNVVFTFAITMVGALFLKRCVFKKFVGRVPLWSLKHIGWLIYQAINATLGMTVLQYVIGTPLMNSWCRALGAKVGKNVYMDAVPPVETDCLEIGDYATILMSAQAQVPHSFDRGQLQFGPVKIGKYSSMGINCCAMLATEIGDYSCLGPNSLLSKNEHLGDNCYSQGTPIVIEDIYQPIDYTDEEPERAVCFGSWPAAVLPEDEEVRIPLMEPSRPNGTPNYGSLTMP